MQLVDTMKGILEETYRDKFDLDESWSYQEIPWMHKEMYDELMSMIGDKNMVFISGSQRRETKGPKIETFTRASILISDKGRDNVRIASTQE